MKKRRRRLATNDSARQGWEEQLELERELQLEQGDCSETHSKHIALSAERLPRIRVLLLCGAATLICSTARTFSYLPYAFLGRAGGEHRVRSEAGTDLSGGSTDVALSALRGIFETLKLCHKMLLLLLLLDSHVTVAVVPGLGPELEPRAWRAGTASPWRDSA